MARLTALAQLVRLYAECRGVTSTAELAQETGYSERAIWKAKAELRCSEPEYTLNQSAVNQSAQTCTRVQSPRARTSYTEDINNITTTSPSSPAVENPATDDFDDDVWKIKVKLANAAQDQPMNQMAASFENIHPILDLIAEGYDLDAQIIPTIRKHRHKGADLINGWNYWVTVIRSKHAKPGGAAPKPVRYAQETWDPDELVSCYVS